MSAWDLWDSREKERKKRCCYCCLSIAKSDTYQHFMSIVLCLLHGNTHQQHNKAPDFNHTTEFQAVQDEIGIKTNNELNSLYLNDTHPKWWGKKSRSFEFDARFFCEKNMKNSSLMETENVIVEKQSAFHRFTLFFCSIAFARSTEFQPMLNRKYTSIIYMELLYKFNSHHHQLQHRRRRRHSFICSLLPLLFLLSSVSRRCRWNVCVNDYVKWHHSDI